MRTMSRFAASRALTVCLAIVLWAAPPAAAEVRALVVSGLAGGEAFEQRFGDELSDIATALGTLSAQADAVTRLQAPTRTALLQALETTGDADTLFVLVLIGHGTVDADGWHFNLPGPDLDAADLVGALAVQQASRQLVVVATSASGALANVLPQPGRLVVTATKSGGELNVVQFPTHFAAALRDGGADLDRNEIVTLAEAWRFTTAAVAEHYERDNLLASEHPRLFGDGADTLALARLGSLARAIDDPSVARLLDERQTLEAQFVALRSSKAERPAADYFAELEQLLVRMARLQARIDEQTGWEDGAADG